MKDAKTTPWILGTVFLAVVILAGMWFLAVSPQLESAREFREQSESQRSNNELLAAQNRKLAQQFEQLPELKTELAAFRTGIPATIDQARFNRELADLQGATDAFIVNIEFATSSIVGAEPSGATASVPEGFYAVPVAVTVLGSPEETLAYLDGLQKTTDRYFFVSTVAATGQDEAGASGGRPEIRDGDLEIVISGYVYVLTEGKSAPADGGASAPDSGTAPAN